MRNEAVAAEIADRNTPIARTLFGIAYRMLGSVHDAEDAVQDTLERWLRLTPESRSEIETPPAWLRTVLTRRCLDLLDSAPRRRERYRGVWLPEPLRPDAAFAPSAAPAAAADPAVLVAQDETVALAALFAMEALSPVERVSFVLHEAFGVPFPEIAAAVDRGPASCRQAATSARARLRETTELSRDPAGHEAAVAAFSGACATGDLDQLIQVLDPSVVVRADGGRLVQAALRPVRGAERVASYLLGVIRVQSGRRAPMEFEMEPVNGRLGIVVREAGTVVCVADVAAGTRGIREIALQVNPEKLGGESTS